MNAPAPRKTNRDMEHHYFERFRQAYELPGGVVRYADKPDVLLKGDRTIGIEITNFYLEPGSDEGSEQRQRPRRYEVASEAHRLYRAGGGRGIELTIEFIPRSRLRPRAKRIVAEDSCVRCKRPHAAEWPLLCRQLFRYARNHINLAEQQGMA